MSSAAVGRRSASPAEKEDIAERAAETARRAPGSASESSTLTSMHHILRHQLITLPCSSTSHFPPTRFTLSSHLARAHAGSNQLPLEPLIDLQALRRRPQSIILPRSPVRQGGVGCEERELVSARAQRREEEEEMRAYYS